MEKTTLRLIDQVNCKFENLDPVLRRKIVEEMKFMVPYARHTPSFKLGRWDGKVGFATVGGATYINLLDRVLPLVLDAGYDVEIADERPTHEFTFPTVHEKFLAGTLWPEGHPKAGEPILLREHQVEAINNYLGNLQSIQSLSTSAGKTIITACLSKIVESYGRTIVIVPNKSLVQQTEEDYRNVGLDVGVYYGDRKEWDRQHTICTWQSLSIFAKKTRRDEVEVPIEDFLKDVVCVIVDEVHTVKGNELKDLLAGSFSGIPIRWGLTGTVPKEDFEFLSLLSTLGPVVGEVRAKTLQDKGILSSCNITVLQTVDKHVEFKSYDDEYKYLTTDRTRLAWIAATATTIAETEGNTLILVDRIETGEVLRDLIPGSVFIHGAVKTEKRRAEYKSIQTENNKVLICTTGTASTGINIPRLFALMMVDIGKSFTKVIQSVGRLLRTAADKDHAEIYDVCSTLKFSAKHLGVRKKYYNEAEYPFTIKKVDYR